VLTVGDSLTDEHFDEIFAYALPQTADARAILQMIGRVRKTTTPDVHLCIGNYHAEKLPIQLQDLREELQSPKQILMDMELLFFRAPKDPDLFWSSAQEQNPLTTVYLYNTLEKKTFARMISSKNS